MIYDTRNGIWHLEIASAVEQCEDGDTIIVDSESKEELAKIAINRMRPDLNITIKVEK